MKFGQTDKSFLIFVITKLAGMALISDDLKVLAEETTWLYLFPIDVNFSESVGPKIVIIGMPV